MNDIHALAAYEASQLQRGENVGLASRRKSKHRKLALEHRGKKRLARPGRDDGAMALGGQSGREPEKLPLTSAPAPLGIDVENREAFLQRSSGRHSLACFRNP